MSDVTPDSPVFIPPSDIYPDDQPDQPFEPAPGPDQPVPSPDQPIPGPGPEPDQPDLDPVQQLTTSSSFYDEGMFMCEPCFSHGANNCMYPAVDGGGSDVGNWASDDPHSYNKDYYADDTSYDHNQYEWIPEDPVSKQSAPRFKDSRYRDARPLQAKPLRSFNPGDAYPMCGSGQISQCYFQEASPSLVDNCMSAVFDPVGDMFTAGSKVPQAMMLAANRHNQCPYFVCDTQSLKGGNGRMSFDAASCKCYQG